MKKAISLLVLFTVVIFFIGYYAFRANAPNKKFAIILQAGKETHEGMARAVHALLYATELKEKGYEVVLIFDGAGTEWAEELSSPDSQSKLLPMYKAFKKTGVQEIICDSPVLKNGLRRGINSLFCKKRRREKYDDFKKRFF